MPDLPPPRDPDQPLPEDDEPDVPPTAEQPRPDPGPRRLTRSSEDRVVGGVAGGLGRYFDVDPVVFRIGFAAGAFVGGAGLLVYLLALAFVPGEGGERAPIDRSRALTIAGLIVLGIAVLASFDGDLFWGPLVPLAVIGGIGYAIYRATRRTRFDGRVTPGRVVAWLAIGTGAVMALGALAFGSAWAAAEGSGAVVAGLVIAIGALLVVSALRSGGSRWLVVPALAIAVPLGVVSAAGVSFDGGFGDKTYRPATVSDIPADGYELGAGALRVDLRDVDFPRGQETVLDLRLGIGGAEVLVPADVCVNAESRFGGGYAEVRGHEAGGLDVDYELRGTAADAPMLRLRTDIGLGALHVSDEPDDDHHPGRFGPGEDGDDGFTFGDDPVDDGACDRVEIAQVR
jgi:phage shock protein PspC (stress-responsive transcriptional regulator)